MNRTKKGFTLVEIMIVVVIIGLLAAMAIPAFNKVRETSQEKAITNNLRQIASAADQYFIESGNTTVTVADLVNDNYLRQSPAPVAGETYPTSVSTTDATLTASGGAPGDVSFNR